MSVRNKLHIAQELLKETASLIGTKQQKRQLMNSLQNLSQFIKTFELQNDRDLQTEKMAFSILNDVINVCTLKMKQIYGLKPIRLKNTQLLQQIQGKTLNVQQAKEKLINIICNDENQQFIKDMNFNVFLNTLEINIKDLGDEQK